MATAAPIQQHAKQEEKEEGQASRAQLSATQSPPAPAPAPAAPLPAQPFDWYADPLFYDIIFQEDTPVETSMLRQIARHFAAEGSPMRRIRPEPESEAETATGSQSESESEQRLEESDATKAAAAASEHCSPATAGHSQPTPADSSPPGAPALCSPALIRVLEPACGSGRLMLSLLEAGSRCDPRDLQWSTTGFDVSEGAVRFAHDRWKKLEAQLRQAEQQKEAKHAEAFGAAATAAVAATTGCAVAAATPVAYAAASAAAPPFTAFVGDMRSFAKELSSALSQSQQQLPPQQLSQSQTSHLSSPTPPPQFDLAHCLVSSLKHLLDPAEVVAHFECVHDVLVPEGLYVVALHIHTLYGRSHFDRDVRYGTTPTADVPGATTRPANDDAAATPATAAAPSVAASSDPLRDSCVESGSESDSADEIDDAFERAYERDGTRFKAELITYAPDAHTMLEKMIARVQIHDSSDAPGASPSPSPSPAPAASSSPSPSPPLQSDMSLRVYTLSSLHTLLCALSPLFSLACVYNYADIYDSDWRASDPLAALPYPYPPPSLAQLSSARDGDGDPAPTHPFVPRAPQRNWNRVYPVSKRVKQMWDGVEAIVLVLRKQQLTPMPTPTQTTAPDSHFCSC